MSIESSIEKTIKDAIARGEFDNLEGKGKPLDLTTYFNTPEDMRMAYSLLKSNKFVPEEVELMKEISDLKDEIAACDDESKKATLVRKLNEKSLHLSLAIEKYKRRK
jgi:Domain of unknown function (DUF1992)